MAIEPTDTTAARINSRKWGDEMFELALEQAGNLPDEFKRAFWSLLAYRIAEHTGTIKDYPPADRPKPRRQAMPKQAAIVFERGRIPFKTSKGDAQLAEIDLDFLKWLLRKHREESRWFDQLDAYLNSEHVAEEETESENEEPTFNA